MSIDKPEVGDINWDGSLNAALDELDARETVAGAQSKATAAYIAATEWAEQRVSDIELTPGAKGDTGDPGPPGNDGGQGPAGIVDDHTLADRVENGAETPVAITELIATGVDDGSTLDTALAAKYGRQSIYVVDYLPGGWVSGDDATAAVASAFAAAGSGNALGVKGCVVLPNDTIALSAEVVTAFTGMAIIGGGEKSLINLTAAGARIRINTFRVQLEGFRVKGNAVATNGIVFSNGARARGYKVRVEGCVGDGWVVDPGSVVAGNCNLITLFACESVSNGGNGFAVTNNGSVDSTTLALVECEGTSNTGHGALLRDDQARIMGGAYMSNGGFGIKLGEAGDTLVTTGVVIDYPRIEGNTAGPFSEGVGIDSEIRLNKSYADATPGGSGGTSGYVVNASGNNIRVGYSGTIGGYAVRNSNGGSYHHRASDASIRISPATGLLPSIRLGTAGLYTTSAATPEGTITATVGSLCITRTSPYALYRKISGTGNTGWRQQGVERPLKDNGGVNYTCTDLDYGILAFGTTTITLPAPATALSGREYMVKNISTGVITVTPASGLVDGAASTTLSAQWDARQFITNGTAWYTVGGVPNLVSGLATLVAGTVTVANTSITANSIIRVASKTLGGTPGALYVSAKSAGASFTISSTNAADTSVVRYDILAY